MKASPQDTTAEIGCDSDDAKAIAREARKRNAMDRMWRNSVANNPDLARALELQDEIDLLAEALASAPGQLRSGLAFRAKRVLVRRFGKLGAGRIIHLTADVAPLRLKLILRARTDKELSDGGKIRREIELDQRDARLATLVHRNREAGMSSRDAIISALEETDQIMMGVEGAKKALANARRRARQREYLDPNAPFIAWLMGGHAVDPEVKVADLAKPGRPRKKGEKTG